MSKFAVGDRVRCIDNRDLLGKVDMGLAYKVAHLHSGTNGPQIVLAEIPTTAFNIDRFELLTPMPEMIPAAEHYRRVDELLAANNALIDRERALKAELRSIIVDPAREAVKEALAFGFEAIGWSQTGERFRLSTGDQEDATMINTVTASLRESGLLK